jgi:polysaccharide biosynthesis protein PslH
VRILFLTSQLPFPPHSGGALRAVGLIQGVIKAGHEVELFCFSEEALPAQGYGLAKITSCPPPTRTTRQRLRDLLLSTRADISQRFWSDTALALIAERVPHVDIVHAESIEMAAYLPALRAKFPNKPLIYGSLNAEADLQRTIFATECNRFWKPRGLIGAVYSGIQWRRLLRFEGELCRVSNQVLAVSEEDARLLGKLSNTPITVVKNGIATADYLHLTPTTNLGEGAIVFTGTMDYRPNVDAVLWFGEEIFPRIRQQHPTAKLYVVGNRPHRRLDSLRQQPNIEITGRVESMEAYWTGASVYIAPLRMGSGTRFKLLEAMAAGCAVVSTTIGAQGLGVTSGRELLLADSPTDFADVVGTLLKDSAQREALRQTGRDFVRQHFDWAVIVPHLLDVYEQLAR